MNLTQHYPESVEPTRSDKLKRFIKSDPGLYLLDNTCINECRVLVVKGYSQSILYKDSYIFFFQILTGTAVKH